MTHISSRAATAAKARSWRAESGKGFDGAPAIRTLPEVNGKTGQLCVGLTSSWSYPDTTITSDSQSWRLMPGRTRAAIYPGTATIATATAVTSAKLLSATNAPVEKITGKPVTVASAWLSSS